MTFDRKQALSEKMIFEALVEFRECFNQKPTDKALETYAKLLSNDYEFKQVTWAMSEIIKSGKPFFPSCGEIFQVLRPVGPKNDDQANLVVGEIYEAIKNFDQYRELEMYATLSEDARLVLRAMGGTYELRNSPVDNMGTTKAQMRDLAKGIFSARDAKNKNEKLSAIGIMPVEPASITRNSPGLRVLKFEEDLPRGEE